MKKTGKILLTDINADREREKSLIKFQELLAAAFEKYATVKLSLNLFTMYEMSEEISLDRREEIEEYIDLIDTAVREVYIDKEVEDQLINDITKARDSITSKMKVLTSYTDALQIYEYILNRKEPAVLGTAEEYIDTDSLANSMYEFVFSENDKMLVNTRIQEFIAQLPVRITKNRFYDIISNSLSIYRGGEQQAANEFLQTIRDASMISKPDGFDTVYPELNEIYKAFKDADYIHLDKAQFDELEDKLSSATEMIQSAVTDYLMLTEIINDVLVILYSDKLADKSYMDENYNTSVEILTELINADDIYEASSSFDEKFVSLEGVQESSYEELAFLESNLDDLYASYGEMYDDQAIKANFEALYKADKLTSTSLFMDIETGGPVTVVEDQADDIYIVEEKEALTDDFDALFETLGKLEKRSVMAKVLSLMPVFFNTQEEILEYFKYALSSCSDKAELTAFRDIANDLMMG
ncbi:MAG: hypothetical protein K6F55_09830 [Eubacterium sp.]|nr:hypothetical protein [Eubacterium sp.]